MKQRSVFFKIGLGFVALYSLYSAVFTLYSVDDAYFKQTQQSFMWASGYLKIGQILLKSGNSLDLSERLDDAIKNRELDFYLIRQGGVDLAYGNAAGADDPLYLAKDVKEGRYETPSYRQFIVHEGDYELIVGHKTSRLAYLKKFWQTERDFILKDIGFVTLLMIVLTLYSFRDIRAIVESLSIRGARRGKSGVARSREALTLIQGLKGFENKVDHLRDENELLKGQVLPALRKELWSGQAPPYEFEATMARIDINNFTTIFSGFDRVHFMDVINDFFLDVTHIVSRYGGSVYEFIGDEVIFYFKDQPELKDQIAGGSHGGAPQNSAARAVSAVRDIFNLAEQVHGSTLAEKNYAFRVKSSLAHGTLRFGPLVNGFALAGNPLIETVRILSHIHEKTENSLVYDETVRHLIGSLVASRELKVVMLKGLSEARRLHQYQTHVPLSNHLRQDTRDAIESTTYYRSDADIAEILEFAREHWSVLPKEHSLRLFALFQNYHVTKPSAEIRQSYLRLLDDLIPRARENAEGKTGFILASVISAAGHLFTAGELNGRVRERLLLCMEIQDRRIIANTLDIFADLEPISGERVFDKLVQQGDNRVMANLLVRDATLDWNKNTARRLRSMLRAPSAYAKASGLYALGEIASKFKTVDEVAYEANEALQLLLNDVVTLAIHANRMVRRQAFRAALKTDRLKDLQDLLDHGERPLVAEVRLELAEWLMEVREKGGFADVGAQGERNMRKSLGVLRLIGSARKSG